MKAGVQVEQGSGSWKSVEGKPRLRQHTEAQHRGGGKHKKHWGICWSTATAVTVPPPHPTPTLCNGKLQATPWACQVLLVKVLDQGGVQDVLAGNPAALLAVLLGGLPPAVCTHTVEMAMKARVSITMVGHQKQCVRRDKVWLIPRWQENWEKCTHWRTWERTEGAGMKLLVGG